MRYDVPIVVIHNRHFQFETLQGCYVYNDLTGTMSLAPKGGMYILKTCFILKRWNNGGYQINFYHYSIYHFSKLTSRLLPAYNLNPLAAIPCID